MRLVLKVCLFPLFCAVLVFIFVHLPDAARCQVFDEFVDTTRDTPELSTESQEMGEMLVVPRPTPTPRPVPGLPPATPQVGGE